VPFCGAESNVISMPYSSHILFTILSPTPKPPEYSVPLFNIYILRHIFTKYMRGDTQRGDITTL